MRFDLPYPSCPALDDVLPALEDAACEAKEAINAIERAQRSATTDYPIEALIALRTALEHLREATEGLERDAEPVMRKLADRASEED